MSSVQSPQPPLTSVDEGEYCSLPVILFRTFFWGVEKMRLALDGHKIIRNSPFSQIIVKKKLLFFSIFLSFSL